MDSDLQKAKAILKKYGQEHLLFFYNELDNIQRNLLLEQIFNTDFEKVLNHYTNSFIDDSIDYKRISPIKYKSLNLLTEDEKKKYISIGKKIIQNNELAVITLAGGQGTRLGYNGPKGCYELELTPKKSLFEFISDKLTRVYEEYGIYLNWYIMTSVYNKSKTQMFFKEKKYFNYPKEKIYFFKQNTIPLMDTDGKLLLDNMHTIKTVPNGNGDVFNAFYNANLISTLDKIKWISISGVDNIMLNIIDPLFIGISEFNNSEISAKSIAKKDLLSKDYVFANVDNCVNIIPNSYLPKNILLSKNADGLFNYNQINILSHLFTKEAFLSSINKDLTYHRAFKKYDILNDEGVKVKATEPNSFKFEKFIFDIFKYFKRFTLLEVNEDDEFAPIKSFSGKDTPENALKLYKKKLVI